MKNVRMACAALNQTPLDWENNLDNILGAIQSAKQLGVKVLCLPELCISGYGCEDAFHDQGLVQTSYEILDEIAKASAGIIVSLGLPVLYKNGLFNAAAIISNGEVLGFVAKQFLAGDGLHYEPRWFKRWPAGAQTFISYLGRDLPMGDLIFDIGGLKIGCEICEDAWVAQRPGSSLAKRGVDVICNPSASHFSFNKHNTRKRFVEEGSRAFGVAYLYSNLMGCESGRVIYDGGTLIATGGKIVSCGVRFSLKSWELNIADIDIDQNRLKQARTTSFEYIMEESSQKSIYFSDFNFGQDTGSIESLQSNISTWELSENIRFEEFWRAVSSGLWDSLKKARVNGFVVSLSGGADSGSVATLVALMLRRACNELDRDSIQRVLGPGETYQDYISKVLTCIYQSTCNSSEATFEAASNLCEGLGIEINILDIEPLHTKIKTSIEEITQINLNWAEHDIALQNIQARLRSPGAWMLANLKNAILLCTSNRSEASLGYATMDGDTSGGLAPIGGIDKHFLIEWLTWMHQHGPENYGVCSYLSRICLMEPSAELRPPDANQTDESDLMPYEILREIERAFLVDRKNCEQIYIRIRDLFTNLKPLEVFSYVRKFFELWSRNQWKRDRMAPAFHLDDASVDPKTWCRFPIYSGAYQRELNSLELVLKERGELD